MARWKKSRDIPTGRRILWALSLSRRRTNFEDAISTRGRVALKRPWLVARRWRRAIAEDTSYVLQSFA